MNSVVAESRAHPIAIVRLDLAGQPDKMSNERRTLRVMLVDSNEVVRAGIGSVLSREPDIEVLGARSPDEAVRSLEHTHPDVTFISDRPGEGGPDLCRTITARDPSTAVIVLSARLTAESLAVYLEAGATGFLAPGASAEDFAPAVRGASRGMSILAPDASRAIFDWARHTLVAHNTARLLSHQEIEIVSALAQGLSNKAIAGRLGVAERVVKARMMSAMRKLGAERRAGLVGAAIRAGIIPGERDPARIGSARVHVSPRIGGYETVGRESGRRATTVIVVDDREVIRAGLSVVLHGCDDFNVVGAEADAAGAVRAILRTDPDVVLVDVALTHMVTELGTKLAENGCRTALVGLCPRFDEPSIRHALQSGARLCIVGETNGSLLRRTLGAGVERVVVDATSAAVDWRNLADRKRGGRLSPTERRVLELLVVGLTNGQIAAAASMSQHNVKRLVRQIYTKMFVRTRAEAVAVGLRDSLLHP